MEMCYKSKGVSNYLDVRIGTEEELKQRGYQFQIRMLEENEIPYLLRPVRIEMDGVLFLKYELNAVYVARRMIQRLKPDGKLFAEWLDDILNCIAEIEQYLLVPDNLVLSPDYMFYRRNDKALAMLYIPGYEQDIRVQLKGLMEYIMQRFDADDRTGIQFLYKAYELVCTENADIRDLRRYIRTGDANFSKTAGRPAGVTGITGMTDMADMTDAAGVRCVEGMGGVWCTADAAATGVTDIDTGAEAAKCVHGKENSSRTGLAGRVRFRMSIGRIMILTVNLAAVVYMLFRYYRYGRQKMDIWLAVGLVVVLVIHIICCFGEQEDVDEVMREYESLQDESLQDEGLQDVSPAAEPVFSGMTEPGNIHSLVPLTNGALNEIRLDDVREKCVVGRGRRETDYRIATMQISRIHACIYCRKEGIFIEDRDSTNGTYINAVRIPAMEPRKLMRGDVVGFANEEFFVS